MCRKAAPAYTGKENTQLEQDVDEYVLDLVNLIRDHYLTAQKNQLSPDGVGS